MWSRRLLDKVPQLLAQLGRRFGLVFQDDKRDRFDQAVGIHRTDDATFQYGRMLQQDSLDVGWPDSLAAHLEHVVRAARVPEITIFVHEEFVTRVDPMAAERVFGLFVFVPIAGRDAVAFDHQCSHFSRRKFISVVVDDSRFVPSHHLPRTARLHVARTIGNKDVEDFRRTNSVTDIDAEPFLPRERQP